MRLHLPSESVRRVGLEFRGHRAGGGETAQQLREPKTTHNSNAFLFVEWVKLLSPAFGAGLASSAAPPTMHRNSGYVILGLFVLALRADVVQNASDSWLTGAPPILDAAPSSNTSTATWIGRRLQGRGRGRYAGRGHGRSSMASSPMPELSLPLSQTPPGDRVCYPLAPNEPRQKQGQVVEGTSFGVALSAIAALPNVRRVLELGTWYGGGSTVNLARGIRDSAVATIAHSLGASAPTNNCIERAGAVPGTIERCCHSLVVTVEVFEPAWEHARRYLRDWPVWCVRGSTVGADEMLKVTRSLRPHPRPCPGSAPDLWPTLYSPKLASPPSPGRRDPSQAAR